MSWSIVWLAQTEYEGQAKKYMDVVDPADAIITVGGDGTVSEVISLYYRFLSVCVWESLKSATGYENKNSPIR